MNRASIDRVCAIHRLPVADGWPHADLRAELARIATLPADDRSALDALVSRSSLIERIVLIGEVAVALWEGNHSVPRFRVAADLAEVITRAVEANPPQDAGDPELVRYAMAAREWVAVLAAYALLNGHDMRADNLLFYRARITNNTLGNWPHLVGCSMIGAAWAAARAGQLDLAARCHFGVRGDLGPLVERVGDPRLPEVELVLALYWLERSCEAALTLTDDDPSIVDLLARTRHVRQEHGLSDDADGVRTGPIAAALLPRAEERLHLVRAVLAASDPFAVCVEVGCTSAEEAFVRSAIGSHQVRTGILA
ncbi:MAG: hypothetical protein AAF211_14100, partial [Myxococcota bacterium]